MITMQMFFIAMDGDDIMGARMLYNVKDSFRSEEMFKEGEMRFTSERIQLNEAASTYALTLLYGDLKSCLELPAALTRI